MNNEEVYEGYQEVFKMDDDNSVFREENDKVTTVKKFNIQRYSLHAPKEILHSKNYIFVG